MGIDGILLSDAIWIIHIRIWIRYVNHYLESAIELIYIYIYTHQLQSKSIVLYLNNIN
jgi:hypothetical protein